MFDFVEKLKKNIVALTSTEAEYIRLTKAAPEAIWLKQTLNEIKHKTEQVLIYCDNQSSISLAKNPEYHARSKHIDIRHHFIREMIKEGELEIKYLITDEMSSDLLTKGLPRVNITNVWMI